MVGRHIVAAVLGIVIGMPAALAADGREASPRRQPARAAPGNTIKDGKQDGQLTKRELDKLAADQAAVRAEEKVLYTCLPNSSALLSHTGPGGSNA